MGIASQDAFTFPRKSPFPLFFKEGEFLLVSVASTDRLNAQWVFPRCVITEASRRRLNRRHSFFDGVHPAHAVRHHHGGAANAIDLRFSHSERRRSVLA
jgi:hypothetical protein